jgi:3-hydroxyisobutyrate dehydrogenase-like beta-hydroxyacid dehydrogenase
LRRELAKPHLDAGATWADSIAATAKAGEMILTSLPGPAEVEKVALGPGGILENAQPGSVYADLSTNSPTVMRKIHAAFKAKGVHVLDAPISGGVIGARDGTVQVMVGGDEGVFNEVKGVLGAIGSNVGYMGTIGAGTVAKLVHNMISILSRALIAEGFTLGVKAGVKPEAILEALRGASFGKGYTLSHHIPDIVFKGDFDTVRFGLKLARKDVGLADRARARARRADGDGERGRAISDRGAGARMGRQGLHGAVDDPGRAGRGESEGNEMKIGVSLTSAFTGVDGRTGARYLIERAGAARRAGLDSLFVGDHHATPGALLPERADPGALPRRVGRRAVRRAVPAAAVESRAARGAGGHARDAGEGPFHPPDGLGDGETSSPRWARGSRPESRRSRNRSTSCAGCCAATSCRRPDGSSSGTGASIRDRRSLSSSGWAQPRSPRSIARRAWVTPGSPRPG